MIKVKCPYYASTGRCSNDCPIGLYEEFRTHRKVCNSMGEIETELVYKKLGIVEKHLAELVAAIKLVIKQEQRIEFAAKLEKAHSSSHWNLEIERLIKEYKQT